MNSGLNVRHLHAPHPRSIHGFCPRKTDLSGCKIIESTADQNCERQLLELREYAERSNVAVVAELTETASGSKNDRAERAKVLKLAQARKIDVVICSELSRWGRSTQDLLETLNQLAAWGVSLIPLSGMQMDLSTPQGKLMLTILARFSEFERDMIRERVVSGLANARAKGKILGRQVGQNPSDKYAPKVIALLNEGVSHRRIAERLDISKNTVLATSKRRHAVSGY